MEFDQLRQLKDTAKRRLGGIPGVEGIGIGDGRLRVYVHDHDVIKHLPRTLDDVDLEFVITGDVTAASG